MAHDPPDPKNTKNLNGLRVVLHGHASKDVPGPQDVTQWVSAIRMGHAVAPPWDTMTIQLRLPRHLMDLVLPGDQSGTHHRIHTGGWVLVHADVPTGDDKHLHGPAVGWGCIDTISFGFQDVAGISKVPVQGTTPVTLQCVSWLTAAGRSNLRLAISNDQSTRGGVQDATTWLPVIVEAIQQLSTNDLGKALQQIWELVAQVNIPDTIMRNLGEMSAFGRTVPVVYDDKTADKYAPSRRDAVLPVRGKGLLNLPVIQPESDLWQWLGAVFVPDANIVELFPSLEMPQLTPSGANQKVPVTLSTTDPMRTDPEYVDIDKGYHLGRPLDASAGGGYMDRLAGDESKSGPLIDDVKRLEEHSKNLVTVLGQSLQGAQPVLVYRLKPFLLKPINAANVGRPTMSEKLKVNQTPVKPDHFGVAQEWYAVQSEECLGMSVQYNEQDRVNLTFARPTYVQMGALRAYSQFGSAVMPVPTDFNKYGLRAYEPQWPYLPESSKLDPKTVIAAGQAAAKAPANMSIPEGGTLSALTDDFSALNELIWALCADGERFAHATLTTRSKPWCRAGHWISGSLGPVAGDGHSKFKHWTGYIEAVEHTFEVDAQARWHSATQFTLSRVRFSTQAGDYYTPMPRTDGAQPNEDTGGVDAGLVKMAAAAEPVKPDVAKLNVIWQRAKQAVKNRPDMTYQRGADNWKKNGKSDCSSFVWHILGFDKKMNTVGIWKDAKGPQKYFRLIPEPLPGAIAVYGEAYGPKKKGQKKREFYSGHTGIIDDVKTKFVFDTDSGVNTSDNTTWSGIRNHRNSFLFDGPNNAPGREMGIIFVEFKLPLGKERA